MRTGKHEWMVGICLTRCPLPHATIILQKLTIYWLFAGSLHFLGKRPRVVTDFGTDWGVQFAAVEWSALCLFLFQSRRDDPMSAQGGAHASGANVAQPWDSKTLDSRTPKGWP